MADSNTDNRFSLFGFEITRKKAVQREEEKKRSFVAPADPDGSSVISAGGHYGEYIDLDASAAKSDSQLIMKYREAAQQPECDAAIDDIVNEAIVSDEDSAPVTLNLDDLENEKLKKVMLEEFDTILELLNFNSLAHEIFRRWYIDGRLYYHIMIDEANPKKGIVELRPIDAVKIRKIRKYNKEKDVKTGITLVKGVEEYFLFQEQGTGNANTGIKIAVDSVCYITSGILDSSRKRILSHIHKALKPVNQLRMMEDSLVIYRLARAPERRIFYIDVGNLPKGKADEYMNAIMNKHRNKLMYDASTGALRDDRKHMSMLEDFWLPRREGGRGTEISTLPGGDNLGQIEDILYFQKQLYKSLNVPLNRMEQEAPFSLGRSTEISRDEVKLQKFVDRLRKRFSQLFMQLLRMQMIVKGYITDEEWNEIKEQFNIDFLQDNFFSELKEQEMLQQRVALLRDIDDFVGRYFSVEWVQRNVLQQDDDTIKEIAKQIKSEGVEDEFETRKFGPGGLEGQQAAFAQELEGGALANDAQDQAMAHNELEQKRAEKEAQAQAKADQADQAAQKKAANEELEVRMQILERLKNIVGDE